MNLPKWDELFEHLWKERSTLWVTPHSKEFSIISYDAAKDIALRVMQNAIVPLHREILANRSNCIHISGDAFLKLKKEAKYLPADSPSARCLGLSDPHTGVHFYTYIEEISGEGSTK